MSHARGDTLERQGWFDEWGVVYLDECHRVTAATFGVMRPSTRTVAVLPAAVVKVVTSV